MKRNRQTLGGSVQAISPANKLRGRLTVVGTTLALLGASGLTALSGSPSHAEKAATVQSFAGIDVVNVPAVGPDAKRKPELTAALTSARGLSDEHPDLLSYPYVDDEKLVITATRPLTDSEAKSVASLRSSNKSVPVQVKMVEHSLAVLEAIKHDLVGPHPEGPIVAMTATSASENRVILTVHDLNEKFAHRLAKTYPASALAFDLEEGALPMANDDRDTDFSPFLGGNSLQSPACSGGFSWVSTTPFQGTVTAGHCTPAGWSPVWTPVSAMGSVANASEESWNEGLALF